MAQEYELPPGRVRLFLAAAANATFQRPQPAANQPVPQTEAERRAAVEAAAAVARQEQEAGRSLAAGLVWHPKVLSDFNLAAFTSWCAAVHPDRAREVCRAVHVVLHQPEAAVQRRLDDGTAVAVPPSVVLRDGQSIQITTSACPGVDCRRCGVAGGFKFHWQGPWTCQQAVGALPGVARGIWTECRSCAFCCRRLPGRRAP